MHNYPTRYELLSKGRMVRCFCDRPSDIWTMFTQSAARSSSAPALFWGETSQMDYGTLVAQAERLAAALQASGVERGDRLATWLSNRPEYPVFFLACWRLGAVLVPIDTLLKENEARHILEHSGARLLLTERAQEGALPDAKALLDLEHIVFAEELDDWISKGAATLRPHEPDEGALAAILYTSGTTGEPKGVMLAHVNIIHSILHFESSWNLPRGSKSLLAIPACNVTGLVTEFLTFFRLGGAVVLMPPFKADIFIAEAARHQIDHAFMVPAQYKLCLMSKELDKHDLSSWKLGSFGGAPMPEAFIEELRQRLPGLRLSNGYGATETASPVALLSAELTELHPDSVGMPVPCADVLVVDEEGKEVAPGEAGELWVAGPMVASGYWNNAEATEEAFVGPYWKSGDIVTMDESGLICLHDRKKDVVNRGGYKIYSAEVESILLEHSAVAEAAVVGRPDEVLGERAHAFICLKPDAKQPEDLVEFVQERLANYKCPEGWDIGHKPLPRNSNGKILKRSLRERLTGSVA